MRDWPKVELSAGPPPYVDRVEDDEPFITEPKQVVAFGLVDGFTWSLVSFRIEPRLRRGHPLLGGRTLELFLGDAEKSWPLGGGGFPGSIPAGHAISLSAQFDGRAPTVSAHTGVASDDVRSIRAILEDGDEREVGLFDTRTDWPRAFVAFPPSKVPGWIVAFDDRGQELDRWPLYRPGGRIR